MRRIFGLILLILLVAIVARAGSLGHQANLSSGPGDHGFVPSGTCCQPQVVTANSDRTIYSIGDTVFVSAVYNLIYAGGCNPTCDDYVMAFENVTGHFSFLGSLGTPFLPKDVVHTAWYVAATAGTFQLRVGVNDTTLFDDGYLYSPPWNITVEDAAPARLSGTDFVYLGCFNVPCDSSDGAGTGCIHGDADELSFAAGGSTLCYSDSGSTGADSSDGFPGTLFLTGYTSSAPKGGRIGRIKIPVPVISGAPHTAQVTMPPRDVCQPYFDDLKPINDVVRQGDSFWTSDSTLYGSVFGYYNSSTPDRDSFWMNKDDCSDLSELLHIGPAQNGVLFPDYKPWTYNLHNCDYIFEIPQWWATAHTGGRWLAIGNGSREGGHVNVDCVDQDHYDDASRLGCHNGPGFSVFDPAEAKAHAADSSYEISALEVASYNYGHVVSILGDNPSDPEHFSDTDFWTDGAWVVAGSFEDQSAKQAVIFLCEKCNYWSHYFIPPPETTCWGLPDCCGGGENKGYHCGGNDPNDPFRNSGDPCKEPQLWFFDPADYVKAIDGTTEHWAPQPYEVLDIGQLFKNTARQCDNAPGVGDWELRCGGVAYDKTRRLLYIAEERGRQVSTYSFPPVIHVFHIGGNYP